mgnify:FL=1
MRASSLPPTKNNRRYSTVSRPEKSPSQKHWGCCHDSSGTLAHLHQFREPTYSHPDTTVYRVAHSANRAPSNRNQIQSDVPDCSRHEGSQNLGTKPQQGQCTHLGTLTARNLFRVIMNQKRRQILDMLSEKTITVEDAAKLMDKLNDRQTTTLVPANGNGKQPRYLRVEVHDDNDNVSIQIPMALMRAGIKLGAMLPDSANQDLANKGIDINQLTEMEIDELIAALAEFKVNVESNNDEKVRIFCE